MWQLFAQLETIVLTTLVGLVYDFVKNLGPSLIYTTKDTIPTQIPEMHEFLASYRLDVRNESRKKAEEISLHLRAGTGSLELKDYSVPAGIELVQDPEGDGIKILLPYLKPKDTVGLQLVARGSYLPNDLNVSISSPNKIATKRVLDIEARNPFFRFTFRAFFGVLVLLLAFDIGMWRGQADSQASKRAPTPTLVLDQRMVTVAAAANSGLPNLVSTLASSPDLTYFEAGDIAYSQAASSASPAVVDKYRQFISFTLSSAPGMLPQSEANLYYCLGQLDMMRSDEKSAVVDFKKGIEESTSTILANLQYSPKTRAFIQKHNLM